MTKGAVHVDPYTSIENVANVDSVFEIGDRADKHTKGHVDRNTVHACTSAG